MLPAPEPVVHLPYSASLIPQKHSLLEIRLRLSRFRVLSLLSIKKNKKKKEKKPLSPQLEPLPNISLPGRHLTELVCLCL